jgi:hypothetical protein
VNGKYILTLASFSMDIEYGNLEKNFRRLKKEFLYQLTSFDNAHIKSFPIERVISPKTKTIPDVFTNSTNDESFWEQYDYIPLDENIKAMIAKYRKENNKK